MKKCLNCKADVRDSDIHCRNCGCKLQTNKNYIFMNIVLTLVIIGIVGMIALFIASYIVAR